ncbi:hypothetical protein VF13_38790 [Nostoc linckia z16]|nr:hypothetical protein VF13_38790 [Nostoc linckia z16]
MKRVSNNRIKWVHLRLSPAEHKIILHKRANSTCRNLSQYLRNVLLDRPIVTTYRNLSQDDMIQQIVILNQELNAIGNNLNQVTKRLHTLQPSEAQSWGMQFSAQAEAILKHIAEVKELIGKIAERWLR